jgi:hypothetical protein
MSMDNIAAVIFGLLLLPIVAGILGLAANVALALMPKPKPKPKCIESADPLCHPAFVRRQDGGGWINGQQVLEPVEA